METTKTTTITVETTVNKSVEKVWQLWTGPEHIKNWNNASDDWYTPKASNDLRAGGKFVCTMSAKNGSASFDFEGIYDVVKPHELIEYTMGDGRKVKVVFKDSGKGTLITETFDPENENSIELQRSGWQAILDNFKKYAEKPGIGGSMHFETTINAKVGKVYQTMLDEKTYREWTSAFNPTSHYKGSWEKGSKIIFLGSDQDGKQGGMVSRIRENVLNSFVSIEHMGMVQGEKEITTGPEVESWAGGLENYSFIEKNGKTLLEVDLIGNFDGFKDYFSETWPKALDKLKSLCES